MLILGFTFSFYSAGLALGMFALIGVFMTSYLGTQAQAVTDHLSERLPPYTDEIRSSLSAERWKDKLSRIETLEYLYRLMPNRS